MLTSHAAHLPTSQAISAESKHGAVEIPKHPPFQKKKNNSKGEICRLYSEGRCKWADASKSARGEDHATLLLVATRRSKPPMPGLKKRTQMERNTRHGRKRQRVEQHKARSAWRDNVLAAVNRDRFETTAPTHPPTLRPTAHPLPTTNQTPGRCRVLGPQQSLTESSPAQTARMCTRELK